MHTSILIVPVHVQPRHVYACAWWFVRIAVLPLFKACLQLQGGSTCACHRSTSLVMSADCVVARQPRQFSCRCSGACCLHSTSAVSCLPWSSSQNPHEGRPAERQQQHAANSSYRYTMMQIGGTRRIPGAHSSADAAHSWHGWCFYQGYGLHPISLETACQCCQREAPPPAVLPW